MRQILIMLSACVLSCSLAACGGGVSDNDLSTGTGGTTSTRNSTPPGTIPAPTPPLQDITGTGMDARQQAFASDVFRLVNEYRAANGRSSLAWDAPIAAVSQLHTSYQKAEGVLTHAGPAPCTVPSICLKNRLTTGGVAFARAGENVAHGHLTAPLVMSGWIASPLHNDNLLDAGWTHMGVGFVEGVSPKNAAATGPWWTQVFIQR
jgi:uncharacterized protein YkwD